MSYPILIKKIMDLSREGDDASATHAAMFEQLKRLTNRLVEVELLIAKGVEGSSGNITVQYNLPPEGYEDSSGALIAPITVRGADDAPVPGAAITAIVK